MSIIHILRKIFGSEKPKQSEQSYLVVGLGNPGREYAGSRHNIGAETLDFWLLEEGIHYRAERHGMLAEFRAGEKRIVLLHPTSYMNLSGDAVHYWLEKEGIAPERLLVLHDDLHLDFARLQLKKGGSAAGHNGIKHITERLGTADYWRLRIGLGKDYPRGGQVQFVLGKWKKSEEKELPKLKARAIVQVKKVLRQH